VLLRWRCQTGLPAPTERQRDRVFGLLRAGRHDREHHGVRLSAAGSRHALGHSRSTGHHSARLRVSRTGGCLGVLEIWTAIPARQIRQGCDDDERHGRYGWHDRGLLRRRSRSSLRLLRVLQPERRGLCAALVGGRAGARCGRSATLPASSGFTLLVAGFRARADRPRGGRRVATRPHRPDPRLSADRVVAIRIPRGIARGPAWSRLSADRRPGRSRRRRGRARPRVTTVPENRGGHTHVG